MGTEIIKTGNTQLTKLSKFSDSNLLPEKFILNPEFPAVLNLIHSEGEEFVLSALIPIAIEYLNLIEVGHKMNSSAIVLCLKEMIIDFPDWSFPDFKYFFKGFAKGNYNESIWRLDLAMIYEGAKNYEIERTTAREKVVSLKKAELNKIEGSGSGDPEIEKQIQELIKKIEPKKVEPESKEEDIKKQQRANYEAELIKYFNKNGLEFSESNLTKYRTENPFINNQKQRNKNTPNHKPDPR